MPPDLISQLLSFSTVASMLFLALVLISRIRPTRFERSGWFRMIKHAVIKHALRLAFAVSVVATLGSLYYSEVLGLVPCDLCWYQRIFMYPLPIILGSALYVKRFETWSIIPMTLLGSVFSAYHYLIQQFPAVHSSCSLGGSEIACSNNYGIISYGFVTIPMMALTAFVLVAILVLIARKLKHNN